MRVVEIAERAQNVRSGSSSNEPLRTFCVEQLVEDLWSSRNQPLLVVAATVGPLDDGCAIGGATAAHVDSLAAIHVHDLVSTVTRRNDCPFLAVVIVGGPYLKSGAISGGGTRDFKQLTAGHTGKLILAVPDMGECPLLAVRAIPTQLNSIGTISGASAQEVDSLVTLAADNTIGAVWYRASIIAPQTEFRNGHAGRSVVGGDFESIESVGDRVSEIVGFRLHPKCERLIALGI